MIPLSFFIRKNQVSQVFRIVSPPSVGEVVGEKKEFTLFPQAYPLNIPTTNP